VHIPCTRPAHSARRCKGAIAMGRYLPWFTYLASGDDAWAGGRRAELVAVPSGVSTAGSGEGVVAVTEGIGGETLHHWCTVAASGPGGSEGGGSGRREADPGARAGATLCAPLPPVAAGFTVLLLTPPTGGPGRGQPRAPVSAPARGWDWCPGEEAMERGCLGEAGAGGTQGA
jgi:hypothetical protein